MLQNSLGNINKQLLFARKDKEDPMEKDWNTGELVIEQEYQALNLIERKAKNHDNWEKKLMFVNFKKTNRITEQQSVFLFLRRNT